MNDTDMPDNVQLNLDTYLVGIIITALDEWSLPQLNSEHPMIRGKAQEAWGLSRFLDEMVPTTHASWRGHVEKTSASDLSRMNMAATPGQWFATDVDYPESSTRSLENHPLSARHDETDRCFTLSTNPLVPGWETDGGIERYGLSRANAVFVAALVNAYRAGRMTASKAYEHRP